MKSQVWSMRMTRTIFCHVTILYIGKVIKIAGHVP